MVQNQIIKLGIEARANTLRSSIEPVYSIRDIARILSDEYGQKVQPNSVQRYFTKSFKKVVVQAPPRVQALQPDPIAIGMQQQADVRGAAVQERLDTLQQLRDINQDTLDILREAKGDEKKNLKSNPGLALAAIQRIEKQLELQAKLLGDLPSQPTINITIVEAQFNEFKTAVLGVMCPECQRRLAEQLRARLGA